MNHLGSTVVFYGWNDPKQGNPAQNCNMNIALRLRLRQMTNVRIMTNVTNVENDNN